MTQPPLSRQIKKLEDDLGTLLFDRTSHTVALTAAGRYLLPEARDLLRRASELEQAVRHQAGTVSGSMTVGFIGASAFKFLPRLMAAAKQQFPNISIELKEMTAAQQVNALAFGEIDLGILRPIPPQPELETIPVLNERLLLALPVQNELARYRRLELGAIAHEPFVMYHSDAPYLNRMLRGIFDEAKISPPIVQSLTHASAILSLVSVGMGIAIVPEDAREACFDNVVFREIRLPTPKLAELHIVKRKDSRNSAIGHLINVANSIGQDLTNEPPKMHPSRRAQKP